MEFSAKNPVRPDLKGGKAFKDYLLLSKHSLSVQTTAIEILCCWRELAYNFFNSITLRIEVKNGSESEQRSLMVDSLYSGMRDDRIETEEGGRSCSFLCWLLERRDY